MFLGDSIHDNSRGSFSLIRGKRSQKDLSGKIKLRLYETATQVGLTSSISNVPRIRDESQS